MYTTIDELKFVDLSTKKELCSRKVERGSEIILAIPESSRVILQMPRGNLECICPRFLSLKIISKLLDAQKYREAFDILRKERINLNLLVDHDPVKFMDNIALFIKDVSNVQWLNLFVSDLQNIDVTQEMYANNYQIKAVQADEFVFAKKIHLICDRMIELLQNDDNYILTLLTCSVKKEDLEEALSIIWQLKIRAENGDNVFSADEALKYLLYLVDINKLFNVALGSYDFGLVLFCAKRSQNLDPKEYVPFLQELERYEENYRKFKIDCHLKRFSTAVAHISKCSGNERFLEALKIIKDRKLYAVALTAYEDTEYYKQVAAEYGNYLREKNILVEASIMYERAGDIQSAINCARNALEWRRCIALLNKTETSQEEIQKFCERLLTPLQDADKFAEAAYICKSVLQDSTLYINTCLNGGLYSEAIFENDISNTKLTAEIIKHLSNYIWTQFESFKKDLETFKSQTLRLRTIRDEKERRKTSGTDDDMDNAESDMFSDTSSMDSSKYTGSSKGTGKTFRSSKNRRKHERKLLNLKEGNKFEDIALIHSLYTLTTKSYSVELQKRMQDVLLAAVQLSLESSAAQLQVS